MDVYHACIMFSKNYAFTCGLNKNTIVNRKWIFKCLLRDTFVVISYPKILYIPQHWISSIQKNHSFFKLSNSIKIFLLIIVFFREMTFWAPSMLRCTKNNYRIFWYFELRLKDILAYASGCQNVTFIIKLLTDLILR